MDMQLIPRCAPALPFGNAKPVPVYIEERAINTQRAIGTTLSHEVPCPITPTIHVRILHGPVGRTWSHLKLRVLHTASMAVMTH